ncbi:MAG: hypothetical protein KGY65_07260 [Candidatus Thermoplasmatota archaeon]|nr:hypothetical protein [Candidatus Thermoplasmatota archaeon]
MKTSIVEIVETIYIPDLVLNGDAGTFLAIKTYPKTTVSEKKYFGSDL